MTESVDLQALLTNKSAGAATQFKTVYAHLVDKIYGYVSYRVTTKEVATDLVQDIFVELYSALPSFTYQSDAQFYSFVFTITKRKLAKYYEQNKKEAAVQILDTDLLASPQTDTDTKDMVTRALATLEDTTKEIVILHHWSRYTFAEIASLLDMTESAVRVRHHRAVQSLSTTLTQN